MKDVEKFKNWLTEKGAVVLDPTNPWELVRFKTVNGVSVIYTNKKGDMTYTGESQDAHYAYQKNKGWRAVDRKRKNLRDRKAKLAARDGKQCFVHGERLGFDELTIEHLLSFSHGGTDNLNNLVLVCAKAQKQLGNLPLSKKIEIVAHYRIEAQKSPTSKLMGKLLGH